MPKDCKVKKFTVIEHDTLKSSTQVADFPSCEGTTGPSFTAETGYYNNKLYSKHEDHVVGFASGSYVKTGDSTELISGVDETLPSGGDSSYQITTQFFFADHHDSDSDSDAEETPRYRTKDSIVVQGTQFYDNNYQNGEIAVPNKWAIVGGTGKYKRASGYVKHEELGCLPISEENQTLVSKYRYTFKVYLPEC